MRRAFLLFALAALSACTGPAASPPGTEVPVAGSVQANPQLFAGEKNLPGMEGLSWSTAKSDIPADKEGMLSHITIEGCSFSRRSTTQGWPAMGTRLNGIYLEYAGPGLQDCIQKVTAYFTDRLGSNPMLWDNNRTRYWFGLKTEVALGTRVGMHFYSDNREGSLFISYEPVGTMGDRLRVEE